MFYNFCCNALRVESHNLSNDRENDKSYGGAQYYKY